MREFARAVGANERRIRDLLSDAEGAAVGVWLRIYLDDLGKNLM
jgi:hypothetical protein